MDFHSEIMMNFKDEHPGAKNQGFMNSIRNFAAL